MVFWCLTIGQNIFLTRFSMSQGGGDMADWLVLKTLEMGSVRAH